MAERVFVGTEEMAAYLNSVEESLAAGETATISLRSSGDISQGDLDSMVDQMMNEGFHLAGPVTVGLEPSGDKVMQVSLIKGSPFFAALIPFIPMIFIGGLAAYWVFSGKFQEMVQGTLIPLILVATGATVVIALAINKPLATYVGRPR